MNSKANKQALVWGVFLILVGLLLLVNQFVELSPWIWVFMLAALGLGALVLYLADRSDWTMLLATYILWVIAILIALITLNILRDQAIAVYSLLAVALPFLAVYYSDRALWWALIPAYVLLAVGVMIGLITLDVLRDEVIAAYVLLTIALPFLVVYLRNRTHWWALIPAYVLLTICVMIGLTGLGLLDDALVPALVLFAIAIPFFVVYVRDRRQWWALIPGGILAVIGLSFFATEGLFGYVIAALLVLVGVGMLVRVFTPKEPAGEVGAPETTGPESDLHGERYEE